MALPKFNQGMLNSLPKAVVVNVSGLQCHKIWGKPQNWSQSANTKIYEQRGNSLIKTYAVFGFVNNILAMTCFRVLCNCEVLTGIYYWLYCYNPLWKMINTPSSWTSHWVMNGVPKYWCWLSLIQQIPNGHKLHTANVWWIVVHYCSM